MKGRDQFDGCDTSTIDITFDFDRIGVANRSDTCSGLAYIASLKRSSAYDYFETVQKVHEFQKVTIDD
jgi:hypothetical protein